MARMRQVAPGEPPPVVTKSGARMVTVPIKEMAKAIRAVLSASRAGRDVRLDIVD